MVGTPIDYVCVRAEHNRMLFPARAVYVVHEGRWAYCPSGATGAHEWISAGGANLQALNRVGVRVSAVQGLAGRSPFAPADDRDSGEGEHPDDPQRLRTQVATSD